MAIKQSLFDQFSNSTAFLNNSIFKFASTRPVGFAAGKNCIHNCYWF